MSIAIVKYNALLGLYGITDRSLAMPDRLFSQVEQALDGGIQVLQYRDKQQSFDQRQCEVEGLLQRCAPYKVPLIINDDVLLAKTSGAQGVHLGKDDGDVAFARKQLGGTAIIGVSCYNQLQSALDAESLGANYVAFGRFFPSNTKPDALMASFDILRDAKQRLSIPTVAIGGITLENAPLLLNMGVDMLAVIHGLFGQTDIMATAQRFLPLFTQRSSL